jgi:hypothetical protein
MRVEIPLGKLGQTPLSIEKEQRECVRGSRQEREVVCMLEYVDIKK